MNYKWMNEWMTDDGWYVVVTLDEHSYEYKICKYMEKNVQMNTQISEYNTQTCLNTWIVFVGATLCLLTNWKFQLFLNNSLQIAHVGGCPLQLQTNRDIHTRRDINNRYFQISWVTCLPF